jgi:hypothetical protein
MIGLSVRSRDVFVRDKKGKQNFVQEFIMCVHIRFFIRQLCNVCCTYT